MSKVTNCNQRHQRAMYLAHCAMDATIQFDKKLELSREACACEEDAACLANEEPSRSVLYRSAATLAMDAGEYAKALRLAATGLDGKPPDEIAWELLDVAIGATGRLARHLGTSA